MISFHLLSRVASSPERVKPPEGAGKKPGPTSAGPQDGVSVNFSSPAAENVAAGPTSQPHGKLGATGLSSALQALPPEGKAAVLLNSPTMPMSEVQRDACIADLETLSLAGQLSALNPRTLEMNPCDVPLALENLSDGGRIYYRDGLQKSSVEIASLEKLAATARQAELGIIG